MPRPSLIRPSLQRGLRPPPRHPTTVRGRCPGFHLPNHRSTVPGRQEPTAPRGLRDSKATPSTRKQRVRCRRPLPTELRFSPGEFRTARVGQGRGTPQQRHQDGERRPEAAPSSAQTEVPCRAFARRSTDRKARGAANQATMLCGRAPSSAAPLPPHTAKRRSRLPRAHCQRHPELPPGIRSTPTPAGRRRCSSSTAQGRCTAPAHPTCPRSSPRRRESSTLTRARPAQTGPPSWPPAPLQEMC